MTDKGDTCWLTWVNSEIRQCFGNNKDDIQEGDFCQLAEGVAMGKRLKLSKTRLHANFWFAMGAHPEAIHNYFGGVENGRARGFVAYINKEEA